MSRVDSDHGVRTFYTLRATLRGIFYRWISIITRICRQCSRFPTAYNRNGNQSGKEIFKSAKAVTK
jgi:hypothetical protein